MTERQREMIETLGLNESDFMPTEKTDKERIAELESALEALLRGDTE